MEAASETMTEPVSAGLFGSWLKVLNGVGTVWTFALVCLICVDVVMRTFFSRPMNGVAEVASASMVGIVYLQIAASVNNRALTRADFLIDALGQSQPRLRIVIEALFDAIGALIFGLLVWGASRQAKDMFHEGDYFGVEGVFTLVKWPFWAILFLGCSMTAITFLISFFRRFAEWRNLPSPVALPPLSGGDTP